MKESGLEILGERAWNNTDVLAKKLNEVITADNKTSDIYREHDRKVYNVEEGVPGENLPPLHPHCRSTTMGQKWLWRC